MLQTAWQFQTAIDCKLLKDSSNHVHPLKKYFLYPPTCTKEKKERQPTGVWKLERSHITTYSKKGVQQDPNQQDTSRSGFFTQEGTSWFSNRQRNC